MWVAFTAPPVPGLPALMSTAEELSNFIWQIADLLRGPYRPPQYERVMLPMTVLRRFDWVLEPTKERVVAEHDRLEAQGKSDSEMDPLLNAKAGFRFHNHSALTFEKLKGDPEQIKEHLGAYIAGFSQNVRDIFDKFDFVKEVEKMAEANILYLIVSAFCDVDLHPDRVKNDKMGHLFEDLIRRFNEQANETAGDYFTPRDVVHLMVDLLLAPDDHVLQRPGIVMRVLDPACGTGGLLSEARDRILALNNTANVYVYGQDVNPRAYAIAASDFLMREDRAATPRAEIEYGDTLLDDKFDGDEFDYFLANPPFGVDWKKQFAAVKGEHEVRGFAGRFGAGYPRVSDGALLFLQHMVRKFEPYAPDEGKYGARLAIVFSGSPLFTGGAGSGESEIRKWLIENDWLEAVVALPEQMFFNTGIGTYIWLVTNRKAPERRGRIQLIDARERWSQMDRSLNNKRRRIDEKQDAGPTVREYGALAETATSKVFDSREFGYTRVVVERPLRLRFQITLERKAAFLDRYPGLLDDVQALDATLGREADPDWNDVLMEAKRVLKRQGSRWTAPQWKGFRDAFAEVDLVAEPVWLERKPLAEPVADAERNGGWFEVGEYRVRYEPDPALRDTESVPLLDDIDAYFRREVLPYLPDAWMNREKDRVGYEINFNRYFYTYTPPRPLAEIDAELEAVKDEIVRLLGEVTS